VAASILANWNESVGQFVKVMPKDYKRVLQQQAQQVSAG
jgi:glutamate synthase (ferredoxin)